MNVFRPIVHSKFGMSAHGIRKHWSAKTSLSSARVRYIKPASDLSYGKHVPDRKSCQWHTKDFISRLNHELLLSHCASPVFRDGEGKEAILKTGEGTLVIWEWLTANLFFPSKQAGFQQDVLRGSTSVRTHISTLQRSYN